MKTNSLATWPSISPEKTLLSYNPGKSPKQKQGVIKLMPPVPPPDEKTIHELNELASSRPFCTFRKVRRHDML